MSILNLIGSTPIVEIEGFDTGPCKLFIKLESQNPGGSIKDRVAVSMIEDAERRGALKPGGTIVEATAGNTGLGLALVAIPKGYRVVLVMPDKFSQEKVDHLRALGAEVVRTRTDVIKGHPDYYVDRAEALAKSLPNAWFSNQFSNPANPRTHELITGPEIFSQMNHDIDAVVVGVGSGGTLGGLTSFFKQHSKKTEMVIADPVGSVIAEYATTGVLSEEVGSWLVEGIGEDFIPDNTDFSLVKSAYSISDQESFISARKLLSTSGIMIGSSSGTMLAAALRFCREQTVPKRVLTFAADGGLKYLSKMYNDFWMTEHGFFTTKTFGDLRDYIARHYSNGSVVSIKIDESVQIAHTRMKMHDVSQLPVLDGNELVGVVDEEDLLMALNQRPGVFKQSVKEIMSSTPITIRPDESLNTVYSLLKSGKVALVADEEQFYGVITKMDLVDYLAKH